MKFLILLVCLGLQRYLNLHFSLAQFDWFAPYQKLLSSFVPKKQMEGIVGLVILVLPISLIALILGWVLNSWWVTGLIYGVAILFFCLDGRDLSAQFAEYLVGGKDVSAANARAREILGESIPQEEHAKARKVSEAIFFQSLHHIYAVIFYYLIFGVFGAVTYYLLHHIASAAKRGDAELAPFGDAAITVQAILNWPAARLAGISYALAGATANVFKVWTSKLFSGLDPDSQLIKVLGLTAIKADPEKSDGATVEENKKAIVLVDMSTGVWLAVVLLFTLIAYVF